MKSFIDKYHLKEGLLVAIIFPAIFFLLDGSSSNILGHFFSSSEIILSLWTVNFILIHFQNSKPRYTIYIRITLSFILSIFIYVAAGFLFNPGISLSPVRGNWGNSFS